MPCFRCDRHARHAAAAADRRTTVFQVVFTRMATTDSGVCWRGAAVLGLLLASCAYVAIQDLPNGQHALTSKAKSGGYAVSRQQAVEDANDYCERSRQHATVQSFDDLPAAGLDAPHSSRLLFTCND
jgi:hypothetical protein